MGAAGAGPSVVQVMGWRSRQYGSFERFLVALSRSAAARGVRSHFVFPAPPASARFLADAVADVHVLPPARGPVDPAAAARLAALLRRVGATGLHAHFGVDAYLALGVAAALRVDRRVTTKHITPSGSRASRLRHRWLAARVDTVFAVSQAVADRLAALGVPGSKISVAYLGVDPRTYRPDPATRAAVRGELGLPPERPLVLCTSHLRPGKGVELLPRLAADLADLANADGPGCPADRCFPAVVAVAGDGPLRSRLEEEARRLGLADRLRLLGVREDVPRLLAAADLYVFPTSGSEGMPLAPLEAMAAGVPVVATAVSDLPRLFPTAALVPPGDPAAFADACRRALTDPAGSRRSAERARRIVLERLTVDAAVQAHLGCYLGSAP